MTIIRPNCRRCGEPMPPIDDETREGKELKTALYKGSAPITHDVCPRDVLETEQTRVLIERRFEARVSIVEVVEVVGDVCGGCDDMVTEAGDHVPHTLSSMEDRELAEFMAHTYAADFEAGVRPLAMALGEKWLRVEQAARIIDMPDLIVDDGGEPSAEQLHAEAVEETRSSMVAGGAVDDSIHEVQS